MKYKDGTPITDPKEVTAITFFEEAIKADLSASNIKRCVSIVKRSQGYVLSRALQEIVIKYEKTI